MIIKMETDTYTININTVMFTCTVVSAVYSLGSAVYKIIVNSKHNSNTNVINNLHNNVKNLSKLFDSFLINNGKYNEIHKLSKS